MVCVYDLNGSKNPNYRTGLACNGSRKSLYGSWQNMKQRCLNPKHPKYKRYGGRGISVCAEWLTIYSFYEWAIANGWQEGLSIDRIDNDGNYEPGNCRWVSMSDNSRRKSTTKINARQVIEIREMIDEGISDKRIATSFGVCPATVWFIRKNITHTDV